MKGPGDLDIRPLDARFGLKLRQRMAKASAKFEARHATGSGYKIRICGAHHLQSIDRESDALRKIVEIV